MGKAKVVINNEKLRDSSELMRALAHPLRIKILEFIDQNGSINVNRIYNTLQLEQSITSQHLRILRSVGLVQTERQGKYIHYSINYEKIAKALGSIGRFMEESKGYPVYDED
jgi:DNA-binding transcriptional ArsR family regulator